MLRFFSISLIVVVLFSSLYLPAFLPGGQPAAGAVCSEVQNLYLPIIQAQAMAQPSILENLEEIMRKDAAFPFDAIVTQVFTNTVNVRPIGSRTIIRDVALPDHIRAESLRPRVPVRLGQSAGKVTVQAYFEQFADPETYNYAGLGSRVPGKPTLTVKATKTGWVLTWPKVTNATKYIIYQNEDQNGDSPELVTTVTVTNVNQASYTLPPLSYDPPFVYFAVQACNGLLEGDISAWVTDKTPPPAPVWKSHAFTTNGHMLTWGYNNTSDPAEVMLYSIYRNTSPTAAGAVEVAETANLTITLNYSDEGDYFGVQATDWSGVNHSAVVWSPLYDPTPTAAPDPVVNMAEFGGFIVNWNAVALADHYEVEGALDHTGAGAGVKWNGNTLYSGLIQETGLSWFRVRALDLDGSAGPWSAWETDNNPPPMPVLATTGDVRSVSVSLAVSDPSHQATGFSHYVFEIADGAAGQNAATLDTHATYASFPRVISQTTGLTQYFRLTPHDWAGNAGPASAWIPATPSSEGATIKDFFDTYGGGSTTPLESLYWLKIASFEASEGWGSTWGTMSYDTTNVKEGNTALKSTVSAFNQTYITILSRSFASPIDLSADGRFSDEDYVLFHFYASAPADCALYFNTSSYDSFGGGPFSLGPGWNLFIQKKKDFNAWAGTPDWSSIQSIGIRIGSNSASDLVYLDDLRIVKVHPDFSPGDYAASDVGRAWLNTTDLPVPDWYPYKGQWHVYAGNKPGEPAKPFSYGQVTTTPYAWSGVDPETWYLSYKPAANIQAGTIQAGVVHKANGQSGLAFFAKNTEAGHWTMYAVEADNMADTVTLVKWVEGTRTVLGGGSIPGFISGNTAQILWLGVDFSQYEPEAGRIKVYASFIEGNLIQAGNLKISIQDTELGSGGTVGLLSRKSNTRFVNFTAGSPAHADVADVSKALDGPWIGGETRRLHYLRDVNQIQYTDDGAVFTPVDTGSLGGVAAANYLQQVSVARPGVTRLYRRDNDSNYSVQTSWDGTRWFLRGYNADTFHAEARVGYADLAANSNALGGYTLAQTKANGSVVRRTTSISVSGTHTVVFQSYDDNTASFWNGSTTLTVARAGWHVVFANVFIAPTASTDNRAAWIILNGSARVVQQNDRTASSLQGTSLSLSAVLYCTVGDTFIVQTFCSGSTPYDLDPTAGNPFYFGLISLEQA